jgi:hypothetical protein
MLTPDTSRQEDAPNPLEQVVTKVVALEDENLQLKHAVHAHATVDQAIGVILALGGLTPDEGWDVLRSISQRTNIKLRHVAELIIEWARTGDLCSDIRRELEQHLGLGTRAVRDDGQDT